LKVSKSGHIERNTHPFRIEGGKAAARKQEVGIPEKIRVGRSNVGAEEGPRFKTVCPPQCPRFPAR